MTTDYSHATLRFSDAVRLESHRFERTGVTITLNAFCGEMPETHREPHFNRLKSGRAHNIARLIHADETHDEITFQEFVNGAVGSVRLWEHDMGR